MLKIIALPIMLPIWALQFMFWICLLPLYILLKICGMDISLAPPFIKTGSSNANSKPIPARPLTSSEFATRFGNQDR